MTLKAIREAAAVLIDNVPGLTVYSRTPLTINEDDVAIVSIGIPGIIPNAHGPTFDVYIRVVVQVNRSTGTEAEDQLDQYIWPTGSASVIAALLADPTVGGTVSSCTWTGTAYPYGVPEGGESGRQTEILFRCGVEEA